MVNKIYLKEINISFPKALRLGMKKAGISQRDLAVIMGVAYPTVNRWVNGKRRPSPEMVLSMVESGLICYQDAKKNPCEDRKS